MQALFKKMSNGFIMLPIYFFTAVVAVLTAKAIVTVFAGMYRALHVLI